MLATEPPEEIEIDTGIVDPETTPDEDHYSWHAGQIALIGKHLIGDRWKYLTVPPGGSAAFNKKMGV